MATGKEDDGGGAGHGSDRLLKAVQAVAISPADAKAVVRRLADQSRAEHPDDNDRTHQDRVARHIVSRYASLAATSGGLTALGGVIPGLGTAVTMVGGGLADAVVCMKLQVDMCACLAEAFGYDILEPDAQQLSFLIAAGGALERAGVDTGVRVASKAGVRMLQQYLKGAALQTVKAFFSKLGILFTRKALEKSLPFGVGVVLGASGDYALTRYVGAQAKRWFILDREDRADEAGDEPRGPEPRVGDALV